jgi:hypothetical protein
MTDKEFLSWVADRLVHVYGESQSVDFVHKLRKISQRTWVGLTDEEILSISADCAATHQHTDIHFARAIEAKLKEKNNG